MTVKTRPITIGGKLRHLRYTPEAVFDAENMLGMGLKKMLSADIDGIRPLATLLYCGLKWEDKTLNMQKTFKLIEEWGNEGKSFYDLSLEIINGMNDAGWLGGKKESPEEEDTKDSTPTPEASPNNG